ncbi:hypothetical protein [Algibacter sp. L4_22]|uniref:hypothetical protein n=1 Tax=Algibacter sp. L4_22 TaxID=2942477 RepID=UPI00201B6941|nr:hypothetical protein [Algibacter sp. L4_22]MCL5130574.1 hypothetical protein [Algibacter sp. L4_22]
MDEFLFFLLLILVPILIIGIPILLTFWIYRTLRKKGINSKWRILAFLPIFIVGYFIYDAFYPSTEFYKVDFKEVTGIELPKDSEFEYKTAGYPDLQGEYSSVSIITIGNEFYQNLQLELTKNGFVKDGIKIGCIEMDNAKRKLNELKIESEYSKENGSKYYYVAFLSDKKSILVQRSSH